MTTTKTNERNEWCAVHLVPDGWVVLSPWIRTIDGYTYRHHIQAYGGGPRAQVEAEHLARELNAAARAIAGG